MSIPQAHYLASETGRRILPPQGSPARCHLGSNLVDVIPGRRAMQGGGQLRDIDWL